jgi:hypothetical protein
MVKKCMFSLQEEEGPFLEKMDLDLEEEGMITEVKIDLEEIK